jgi:3-oxoacyl-[acyl-carrier protein] reductase
MSDPYLNLVNSGFGGWLAGRLGLPQPTPLRRYQADQAALPGPVLAVGGGGRVAKALARLTDLFGPVVTEASEGQTYGALVFDASACGTVAEATHLYEAFHASIRAVAEHGRILVIGRWPETCQSLEAQSIQRGLEGFVRSIAKEVKRAIAVNLVYLAEGAETEVDTSLAFFLSARSAYVSGQVVRVGPAVASAPSSVLANHAGRRVLVTGASRGIGAAIARLFVAEGAEVIALDVPSAAEALDELAAEIGLSSLTLDITAPGAAEAVVADARSRGGYDVVVHNAGITRDKTIARMDAAQWNAVMAVNLSAPLALTEALLAGGGLRPNGRIIGVSSMSGIAGNMGQSNYALSKAGLIGAVQHLAPLLAKKGVANQSLTINAVAPGFIETSMTAAIPFTIREAGRRMNSMGQGGQPEDVAQTIAWLAHPASNGLNGQVVRVCGQSLLGA